MSTKSEARTDWGEVILEHRVSAKLWATTLIGCGVAIIAASVVLGLLEARDSNGAFPTGVVMIGIFIGIAVACLSLIFIAKGDVETRFYAEGFEQTQKSGKVSVRFDEIQGFRCWIAYGAAAQIGFRFVPVDASPDDDSLPNWTAVNSAMTNTDRD